nr:uncharacterized protein LOC109780157 [Aegilops tauschii subsp. strangulata]
MGHMLLFVALPRGNVQLSNVKHVLIRLDLRQYKGHVKGVTVILEAVVSQDLWIWHSFFGMDGCHNDINVLQGSPVCGARHAASILPRALSPLPLPLPLPLPRPATTAPPCFRERPGGTYYAEIRFGDVRLGLGTFGTAHEAARAYDAAAWRLERPRAQMNFHDVYTREQTQAVALPPHLITDQDRAEHHRRQRRLLIAEEDERAMAEWRWRHPEDVANERAYWAERTARRRAERVDRRRRKALAISQCDIVEAGGESLFC